MTAYCYLHLPFCLSKCTYCDFVVALKGTPEQRTPYLAALIQDIEREFEQHPPTEPLKTLYLGGGTPSRFTAEELHQLLQLLDSHCRFTTDIEITLELNPEQPASTLAEYRQIGINRLSIGVQSMQPNELKRLARLHRANDVIHTVQHAREAGFDNLSLDLMIGLPEQTQASWLDTLDTVLDLSPEHLSMYGLQLESGTALEKMVQQQLTYLPDETACVDWYGMGQQRLALAGYEQYEISNWAKPGYESKHNLAYWDNRAFYGFGVGATGYIRGVRFTKPSRLEDYLSNPAARATEIEVNPQEAVENALIFGLRKATGVDLKALQTQLGLISVEPVLTACKGHLEGNLLMYDGGILKLNPSAFSISNSVLDCFIDLPGLMWAPVPLEASHS